MWAMEASTVGGWSVSWLLSGETLNCAFEASREGADKLLE
jgi:hypothetical protein